MKKLTMPILVLLVATLAATAFGQSSDPQEKKSEPVGNTRTQNLPSEAEVSEPTSSEPTPLPQDVLQALMDEIPLFEPTKALATRILTAVKNDTSPAAQTWQFELASKEIPEVAGSLLTSADLRWRGHDAGGHITLAAYNSPEIAQKRLHESIASLAIHNIKSFPAFADEAYINDLPGASIYFRQGNFCIYVSASHREATLYLAQLALEQAYREINSPSTPIKTENGTH